MTVRAIGDARQPNGRWRADALALQRKRQALLPPSARSAFTRAARDRSEAPAQGKRQ